MVFKGLIRKGELGGFGLENLGNIGDLNGTVNLPQEFTPTSLTRSPQKEITEDEMREIQQLQLTQLRQQLQDQKQQARQQQQQGQAQSESQFFGEIKQDQADNFFGTEITKKSQRKVKSGIPKMADLFGDKIKINRSRPLIGNLSEGVESFDGAFGKLSKKKPIKRGTGFDSFVGDIDISRLQLGKPDSAVPKTGIFSKKKRRNQFINAVDLSKQKAQVLPNPAGFEQVGGGDPQFPSEDLSFDEKPKRKGTGRKAGRPHGSVGKKKRQARKLDKSKKRKSNVDRSRLSLLKERARVRDGGAPRSGLQTGSNASDNSFRNLFS